MQSSALNSKGRVTVAAARPHIDISNMCELVGGNSCPRLQPHKLVDLWGTK